MKEKYIETLKNQSNDKLDIFKSKINEMIQNGSDHSEIQQFIHKKIYKITYDTTKPTKGKLTLNDKFEEMISFIISNHGKYDKVVLHIASPGGSVITFG